MPAKVKQDKNIWILEKKLTKNPTFSGKHHIFVVVRTFIVYWLKWIVFFSCKRVTLLESSGLYVNGIINKFICRKTNNFLHHSFVTLTFNR